MRQGRCPGGVISCKYFRKYSRHPVQKRVHQLDSKISVSVFMFRWWCVVISFVKITNWLHQYPKFIYVIKPYMFRASSASIIRCYPLYTRQLVCFMQVTWPLPSRVRLELWQQFQPDSARKRSHNLHEAYQLPCVQWITPDDGHRRCPKHVGFYDINKFWILMHLVGYCYESVCKSSGK